MSFMENQVLGYQSPFYGRRTAQFKIEPFEFFKSKAFFKNFTHKESAVIYGITGGVPLYLSQIDDKISLDENIKDIFLQPVALLFEEPTNLLKQEVRDTSTYNAVIKAIATGSSRHSEIMSKTGLVSSACSEYLNNLISLGIVKKEIPFVTEDDRKKFAIVAELESEIEKSFESYKAGKFVTQAEMKSRYGL